MYFNFSEKLKFTKVYVLFHKFFLRKSQPTGPVIKTKKGFFFEKTKSLRSEANHIFSCQQCMT